MLSWSGAGNRGSPCEGEAARRGVWTGAQRRDGAVPVKSVPARALPASVSVSCHSSSLAMFIFSLLLITTRTKDRGTISISHRKYGIGRKC